MAISDYSTTAASNTAISGIDISGATGKVKDGDNAIRQLMADIRAGVITGYTTTATAAGTTTLTVASNSYQFFTGATTQTVVMPVTSTLELGRTWVFVNNSTGALTVNSSGANLITTVAANTVTVVECILITGTSAASWDAKISGFTSSTGSGAVVRATSPTLTTPTLGVASATSISFGGSTLSNYDEGTWSPTINFAGGATGITYGTQLGRYTRVGRLVTIEAQVSLTNKGSATGAATIVGLPFAINSTLGGALTIAPVGGVFASLTAGLAATFELGTTSMTVRVPTTTGTSAATDANFTNTSSFRLGGSYSV